MRVYLPATLDGLRLLAEAGDAAPAETAVAHAVTPALREWYASGDLEELEYSALADAARASLDLLAKALGTGPDTMPARRAVIAAHVPDAAVRPAPELGRSVVHLTGPVLLVNIAAIHVDDAAAEDDVRRAVAALPAARDGDADAQFLVDGAEGHELLWYATQELPDLLG